MSNKEKTALLIEKAKIETVREFVKRVKEDAITHSYMVAFNLRIDTVAKEFIEEILKER